MGDGKVGMDVPLEEIAARMNSWSIGGRQYQTLISLSASQCATTIGWRALACLSCVATSLRNPVSPVWSCSALVGGGIFPPVHQQNQTHAHLSAQCDSEAVMICGDFNAMC